MAFNLKLPGDKLLRYRNQFQYSLSDVSHSMQTTPQMFGWLIYDRFLTDGDKDRVIEQHVSFNRPLRKYFEIMYKRALEQRLMKTHA